MGTLTFTQRRARVLAKSQHGENGCWLWNGATTHGYGVTRWREDGRRRQAYVHRVAFEVWRGSIPDGVLLHHECHTRNCVNPWHLRPVTQGEHNTIHAFVYCKREHLLAETAVPQGVGRTCGVCRNMQQRRRWAERKIPT